MTTTVTTTELPTATPPDDPTTPVGERLVETASRLFYDRGIRGVGVELIAAEAGTTKKTLYDRFGSKDALVTVYLRRRAARWQRHVLDHLAAHHPRPGRPRVAAVFDALDAWLSQQWRGCAFVNAHAELGGTAPGGPEHAALAVIRGEKAWMRQLFTALVEEAGVTDAEELGGQLHLLYEGAVVSVTAGDQQDAVRLARSAAQRLLR